MMFPFIPYFPNNYYRNYNRRPYINKNSLPNPPIPENREPISEAKKEDKNTVFEIFGISLEFDDLLILGLLFFLYIEEVDDYGLYIALILLLLS